MKSKSIIRFNSILLVVILALFSYAKISLAATPKELVDKYNNALSTGQKVNILIVPGHDDEYWGTEFRDIRESDIVVAIGQYLYDYLRQDERLNIYMTRTQMGYNNIFLNYFAENRQAIWDFVKTSRSTQETNISTGVIKQVESVPHATAKDEVAFRLYGINKWANENNIDITLHLHVDDYGGRKYGKIGKYTGFTVYIPESQYQNARASAVFGEALFNELKLKNNISTYPPESKGLIEDQDLIALGAANTAKSATALIEYGYIYEPKFRNLAIQEKVTKDLAHQTYLGIHRFFGDRNLVR